MKINERVEQLREEVIKSVQDLIKIKSVEENPKEGMPFGEGPAKALNAALELSKSLGFKVVNLDNYIGYAEYGDGEDYVGILGHLDVVPEGDGWIYPPYAAEIHDDKIFGRGTLDDKGPMVAALYGLKAVVDSGAKLSKRVRIIFGTNEETGCGEVAYYLKTNKPPICGFTPDGQYPIINGEKGITVFDVVKDLNNKQSGDIIINKITGGNRANMVPSYCEAEITTKDTNSLIETINKFVQKTSYELKAEVKGDKVIVKSIGISAHGSTPEIGKNAIMQLFALIGELNIEKSDIKDYIDFFNTYVGMETDGKKFGVGLEDKVSGKLSFNVGTIKMDQNKVSMALNLRYPVTFKYEDMIKPFEEKISGTGIRIENMSNSNPLYFEENHPLIKTLKKVYEECTGQEATLLSIGGGTYAKQIPNMVAFGPIFPGKPDLDHQANECIEIEDLIANTKIYANAIYELAK